MWWFEDFLGALKFISQGFDFIPSLTHFVVEMERSRFWEDIGVGKVFLDSSFESFSGLFYFQKSMLSGIQCAVTCGTILVEEI